MASVEKESVKNVSEGMSRLMEILDAPPGTKFDQSPLVIEESDGSDEGDFLT